jgi:hypothetical protein
MENYLGHLTSDGKLPLGWAIWRQMENHLFAEPSDVKNYLGHLTSDRKLPFGWAIWRQMKNYLFAEPSDVMWKIT